MRRVTIGRPYEMRCVSDEAVKECSTKLLLAGLSNFWEVEPVEGDILVIPGFDLGQAGLPVDGRLRDWLYGADRRGVTICSVCTGAFALAKVGLLDGRECTTLGSIPKGCSGSFRRRGC